MKTKTKLSSLILLLTSILLIQNKSTGQVYTLGPVYTPSPTHDVIQSYSGTLSIMQGTGSSPSSALTAFGINTETPNFMLDVNAGDIDVNSITNGYRLGGTNPNFGYVLWNNGDYTNLFCGIGAGGLSSSSIYNYYNTFVGYMAGYNANYLNNGSFNAFFGANSGKANWGSSNTFIGADAGEQNTTGQANTFLGTYTGSVNLTGSYNTFGGFEAGTFNTTGDWNTFIGYQCGSQNISGNGNCCYGKKCGASMTGGNENSFIGAHASYSNINGDSSVAMGFYAEYGNTASYSNITIGDYADINGGTGTGVSNYNVLIGAKCAPSHTSGDYNILLGYESDLGNGISNSAAIGASADVTQSNSIILGNDYQWTGIGLSYNSSLAGATGYPNNSLEICARTQGKGAIISDWSGLRFTNLTAANGPQPNPGPGVLALDNSGDVIYVNTPAASLGTCSVPTVISATGGGGIDMNNANFYFLGNGAGTSVNNVGIGWPCSGAQIAKLQIYQNSGSTNSIGEYVQDADLSSGTAASPQPLISLKSQTPYPISASYYNVAGWFEAEPYLISPTQYISQYAIFVPQITTHTGATLTAGTVDIGYQFSTDVPDYLLDVNGLGRTSGGVIPSDTLLKKSVAPFSYGLKAVRNLNPVSYKYNGIGGFDSTETYIGLIAQNLQRNVPNGVKSSIIIKDSITHDTAKILNIYEEAVMYTAINAIKQLDSTVTSNRKTDSVVRSNQQETIDSLRSVLSSIQTCIDSLCNGKHAPINNPKGNSGDNNPTSGETNVQNVTLSGLADAPLLYQNIPNPFSTGTKINYYLPQGTMGATIVFYDSYGNQIKQLQLSQTGNGTLNITPDNLTNGIYSYSLIVNGTVIDTKRMVLQK